MFRESPPVGADVALEEFSYPIVTILISQFLSALIAWGIGAVVLRLKGHYLAIATLSFTIIVEVLTKEMTRLTGGLQGLSSIPPISLKGFKIDSDYRFYFIVWPVTMLLLLFSLNLVDSRIGRIFRAIKEDEDVARLFGADIKKYKIKLFKGNIEIVHRESRTSLFSPEIRSIKATGFDQRRCADAAFVRGLPFEILAKRKKG